MRSSSGANDVGELDGEESLLAEASMAALASHRPLPLRAAIRDGGTSLLGVLLLIGIIDEFPRTAATVLA
ncbi:MAG: hypothetical protein QOK06_886, partial [Acidimicrobiaceae bacterium]